MTTFQLPGPLVSVNWLATHLDHPGLVLLDASMQPVTGPDGSSGMRLPRARTFDLDQRISDRASPLPHMMPGPELFSEEVRALGVDNDSVIVVYDRIGLYSSPRAWWMFKAMGHEQVAVLDGGLPAWSEAGLPCESIGNEIVAPGRFVARPRPGLFCDAADVMAALGDARCAVIDARSEGRFSGREPEPRAGLRGGHMPHALNLPFGAVLAKGRMREVEELKTIFAAKVERQMKLILSCGSGVTSCVLALAAELAGHGDLAVYDGSWSEWGQPSSRPVVPGGS